MIPWFDVSGTRPMWITSRTSMGPTCTDISTHEHMQLNFSIHGIGYTWYWEARVMVRIANLTISGNFYHFTICF